MSVLEEILLSKKGEIKVRRQSVGMKDLERSERFKHKCVSLKEALLGGQQYGIIAEIKRRSPSRGVINAGIDVLRLAAGYEQAGASAISVLTDGPYFGGSAEDLVQARQHVRCPILRKDFIIDEYQIVETKSMGADVLLLIAAAITPQQVKEFTGTAHKVGLEVLLEVHNGQELEANHDAGADLIGVNNRNLNTFEVDLDTSRRLIKLIPKTTARISESGIDAPERIGELAALGFNGFLMGENFMKHAHPEKACASFIQELAQLES